MVKQADGSWELKLDHPMLTASKDRYNAEIVDKDIIKKPRGIAMTLFGGKDGLREALDDGSAWQDLDNSRVHHTLVNQ